MYPVLRLEKLGRRDGERFRQWRAVFSWACVNPLSSGACFRPASTLVALSMNRRIVLSWRCFFTARPRAIPPGMPEMIGQAFVHVSQGGVGIRTILPPLCCCSRLLSVRMDRARITAHPETVGHILPICLWPPDWASRRWRRDSPQCSILPTRAFWNSLKRPRRRFPIPSLAAISRMLSP